MKNILQLALIGHVLFGIAGAILYYMVWRDGFKKKLNIKWLQNLSFWGGVSFVLAWIFGGYYYLQHYGGAVKPIIKSGQYPWAHAIVMEAKEHVFFFLPVLAIVSILFWRLLPQEIEQELKLKKAITTLDGIIAIVAIAMVFSGIVISGAVR